MRVHSGYCTNVLWVLILCLITAVKEKTALMNNEPAAQSQPNNTTVSRAQSVGSHVNNKSRTDAVDVTSNISGVPRPLNSSQEIVQPSHKNISSGAYVRAFYVFVGLGAIVVMYTVVRTVRLRRKKTAVRKYGILTSREDVEMTPLGAEDEEDATLFDMTLQKSWP